MAEMGRLNSWLKESAGPEKERRRPGHRRDYETLSGQKMSNRCLHRSREHQQVVGVRSLALAATIF